jgi:hypothetical protein
MLGKSMMQNAANPDNLTWQNTGYVVAHGIYYRANELPSVLQSRS